MTACFSRRLGLFRCGAAGFLLTETLATFTISAFVLLGLVMASSILLRSIDRSVAHVQDVDDLGRVIDAIKRDISGLTRARWNGYEPQAFVFRGGPENLVFARTERDLNGSIETHVIALREIAAGGDARLMRSEARLLAKAANFEELNYGEQRELFRGNARFRFSYVAPANARSASSRLREWPEGTTMPEAIVIEVVASDTRHLILSVRLPIQVDTDIGCLRTDTSNSQSGSTASGPDAIAGSNVSSTSNAAASVTGITAGAAAPIAFCGRADVSRTNADDSSDPVTRQGRSLAGSP